MSQQAIYWPEAKVRQTMTGIAAQTGQTTKELLDDVMRLWSIDLVRQTFPKQKRHGVNAMMQDIYRLFKTPDRFNSEGIKRSFAAGNEWDMDNGQLQFRPRMKRGQIAEIHEAHRTRRGRVMRRPGVRTVVSKKELNAHARQKQRQIGRLKAGFAAAAAHYGFAVPSFVRHHGTAEGAFHDNLNPQKLTGDLVAENNVPYAGQVVSDGFMRFLQSKRVRDLTSGHYALRWQKKMEAMRT